MPNGIVAKETPTPRQLKQFVNQVGGLRREHPTMNVTHLAYYALLRSDRIDVAGRLTKGELPHAALSYLFSSGVTEDLAALCFVTTPTVAQQLLLGRAIEHALTALDSDELRELSKRIGFTDSLDGLRMEAWVSTGGVELTRAAAVFDDAGLFDAAETKPWVRNTFAPLARAQDSWTLSGRETGVGLAALLDLMAGQDEPALARALRRVDPDAGEADSDGELQIAGGAGLAESLANRGLVDGSTRIALTIPKERIVSALATFARQTTSPGARATLKVAVSTPVGLAQQLLEAIPASQAADVGAAMDVVVSRPGELAILSPRQSGDHGVGHTPICRHELLEALIPAATCNQNAPIRSSPRHRS